MKNILIVDDEKFIRLGIEAIIKNTFEDINIDLARNGQEAYEKTLAVEYDLIISDINMPVMTGIEFIKKLYKDKYDTSVIVLSGFNEFEYARQCMKYGVQNYLLKPVDSDELIDNIREVFQRVEKKLKSEKEHLLKELRYALEGRAEDNRDLKDLLDSLSLNFEGYICYYLEFEKEAGILENKSEDCIYISKSHTEGYLICRERMEIDRDKYIFVTESALEKTILEAFKTADTLRKYRMILGKDYINKEDIEGRRYIFVNEKNIRDVYDYIKLGKKELVKSLIENIFSQEKMRYYSIKTFEEIHESIKRDILERFDKDSGILKEPFDRIKMASVGEYAEKVKELLLELAEENNEDNSIETVYIEKAKEYIADHYKEDLNMAVVSNYVSLNYSYFSSLFKKHMKMNFLDYLNGVRIEKSKEYLKRVDYKIYEVSELVGYKNPKHFSKIFKKIEKITPVEYKLKNMER